MDSSDYYTRVVDVDAPISHWRMGIEDQQDPERLVDRIAGGRDLRLRGGGEHIAVPGIVANSDGAASQLSVMQSFSLPDSNGIGARYNTPTFTIEAWATFTGDNADTDDSSNVVIQNVARLKVDMINGVWSPTFAGGGVYLWVDRDPFPGVLQHLVGVYDGVDLIFYVNGVERGREASQSVLRNPNQVPVVGKFFDGTLDEVAWYDHALNRDRVQMHYRAGAFPGAQRGPIEMIYSQIRDQIALKYVQARVDLEDDYHRDITSNEKARQKELSDAGF
jgi:hypothetical protein